MCADLSLVPEESNPNKTAQDMSKVRISASLLHCTVRLVCICVGEWYSMRETRTQWHTAAGSQKKRKKGKKSRHDENAHVGLIHLTSPSASCLAADPSQFVFGNAQKEVLLGHFRKHTTSPLPSNCLNSLFLDNKLRWAGPCKRHTRSTLD